eukprot:356698-Chlamydomonas_euryale.AAC.3
MSDGIPTSSTRAHRLMVSGVGVRARLDMCMATFGMDTTAWLPWARRAHRRGQDEDVSREVWQGARGADDADDDGAHGSRHARLRRSTADAPCDFLEHTGACVGEAEAAPTELRVLGVDGLLHLSASTQGRFERQTSLPSPAPSAQQTFEQVGLKYSVGGLTGNTMDSHRLIQWAGKVGGPSAQDKVVEYLFRGYFTQERFINDRALLLEAADAAGLQGAAEYLANPENGLSEVQAELAAARARAVSGVPNFTIDGR